MKPKSFGKKLTLGKKTVAHLGHGEMRGVQGGVLTVELPVCHSWIKTECCHPSAHYSDCPYCG